MPYKAFLDQMIRYRDRAAGQASLFGLPTAKILVVRRQVTDGYHYLQIEPNPITTTSAPTSETNSNLGNAKLTAVEYQVKGISRIYTREQLVGNDIDYLLNPRWVRGQWAGGIECAYVSIIERSLAWEMTLSQKVGEQSMYKNFFT